MTPARSLAVASLFEGDAGRVRTLLERFKAEGMALESEIRGWSMTGSLPGKSRIRIHCAHLDGMARGDVVAVMFGKTLVAHRVAHVGQRAAARGFVITRGDATMLADAPATDSDVVGRVVAVDAGAGWVDVPGPHTRAHRFGAALILAASVCALEIHPALARLLARGLWRWRARLERHAAAAA